jgi:hypothetical protein
MGGRPGSLVKIVENLHTLDFCTLLESAEWNAVISRLFPKEAPNRIIPLGVLLVSTSQCQKEKKNQKIEDVKRPENNFFK